MTNKIGVLPDARIPIKDVVECAKLAESHDFQNIWVSDFSPREAWLPLSACALATDRIKIGTSITAFPLRNPLLTAGLVMGMDELSGGRTVLGLGTGAGWLRKVGIELKEPRAMLREYVSILRVIFSGNGFPYEGKFYSISDWNWWSQIGYRPLRRDVPIYTAAVGERMLELAGEISDGVILGSVKNLPYVEFAKRHLEEGARRAGRTLERFDFATLLLTFVDKDSGRAKKAARARLAEYASRPSYAKVMGMMGYGEEQRKIMEAIGRGDDSAAANVVSDKMVDDFTLAGTPEECRAKLEDYTKAGVTHPIIYIILTDGRTPAEVCKSAIEGLAN